MNDRIALRLGALLFALLYGVASFLPTLPEGAYSDRMVLSLVNDGGERALIVVAGYGLAAAGLTLLVWTNVLAARLDDGSALPRLLSVGGAAYGVVVMVAATFFDSLALGVALNELPAADDSFLVRATSNQGFGLLLGPGLTCASLAVVAASILGRRTGAMPTWVCRAGLVVAPLLWLGFAWVPQFLVPLWVVAVAFTLRSATYAGPSAQAVVRSHSA